MPIWDLPLDRELQQQHVENVIRTLGQTGQKEAAALLLDCDIEISERVHEDKWGFLSLSSYAVSIHLPKHRSPLSRQNKQGLHDAILHSCQSVLANGVDIRLTQAH